MSGRENYLITPWMKIDSILSMLSESEATGTAIDAYIQSIAFDSSETERTPPFIIGLYTTDERLWSNILRSSDTNFWLSDESMGIALFEPNIDCGVTRLYQIRCNATRTSRLTCPEPSNFAWTGFDSSIQFFRFLIGSSRPQKFCMWLSKKKNISSLSIELAEGRLSNTSVEKAVIFSRGDGCAFCGEIASLYAATTVCNGKLFIQIQLCQKHFDDFSKYPAVISAIAELLHANIDLPQLQKSNHLPDEYVGPILIYLAQQLGAEASKPVKRDNGWQFKLKRSSGWSWIIRLNSLSDYAYMLMDPNDRQRHRVDTANHHPEINFGPAHQHFRPGTKADSLAPSFTYGHPLFDVVLLNRIADEHERGSS